MKNILKSDEIFKSINGEEIHKDDYCDEYCDDLANIIKKPSPLMAVMN